MALRYSVFTHSFNRLDTTPSTFDRPIISTAISESSNKRNKSSEPRSQTSIAKLIEEGAYTAVEELVKDVCIAADDTLEDLHQGSKDSSSSAILVEHETLRANSLKKRLGHLIVGEMMQRPRTLKLRVSNKEELHDAVGEQRSTADVDDHNKTILTLCGGERSAKQLFSSLAKSDARNATLGEKALPNGITTTKVVPVHSLEKAKETPTIGTHFAPPFSVKPLEPPKQASKQTSTRGSLVSWYNPSDVTTDSKDTSGRDSYKKQHLSTGQWLTYNVAPSSEQLTSPSSKRKHRDRALSTGEPQSAITEETSAARAQAREDALFRSVYSSFAPSHDDFGAVVTKEQKNRIWWTRYGEPQYEEMLNTRDEELYEADNKDEEVTSDLPKIDEKLVEEAISKWVPQDIPAEMMQNGIVPQRPKEADDLLQEISELIEVLDSHQHIRNLSQPTNSRTLQGQKEQLISTPGDPTSPSTAEVDVYESLKSNLVEVIATLPPYTFAKLDSDKLGALRLSTKIKIPGKSQKGTMEEDDLSAKAKAPIRPAINNSAYPAYGGSSAHRSGYPSTTPTQYAQRQTYGQTPVQRQPATSNSYVAQYSGRTQSTPQYPPSNVRPSYGVQYPPQRTTSSYTDRYANGVAQPYNQQQSTQSYGQYPNSYRPSLPQNTSSYSQQYSTPQARIPPASKLVAQAYRGSQTEYQQRAPPPPAYNYGSTAPGTAASPNNSHQPSFSGPAGTASQPRPQLYHQHSSHYGSHSPAEPQTNGAGGSSQERMSPDEQTTVMNRQKAQLVEQQQTRQASGTPQPVTSQPSQQNGTPAPQSNGVAV